MKARFFVVLLAFALNAGQAVYARAIRIGFVTTLSTPAAVIGNDMRNAVELALEHLNHRMGPLQVQMVYGDDEFNPQRGRQRTEELVKNERVDLVAGYVWSNVLLASAPVVLGAGKILISTNAGPSQLAGRRCNRNFFSTSWQNDQTPMAMGRYLNQQGVRSIYLLAPNYAAGKNMVAGVRRTYRGKVLGIDLTRWPSQIEWSAELAKVKAAAPQGVWIFYPGRHGVAFIQQYVQAGLGHIPLYTSFTVDSLSLPVLQKARVTGVMGSHMTQEWVPDLDNPANRRFVTDFKRKYGHYPSFYAAQSYDAIMLIDSAVRATGGDLDTAKLRAALERADFQSVRGPFRFARNHFPIENFYLRQVVKDPQGVWTTAVRGIVEKDMPVPYADRCAMR